MLSNAKLHPTNVGKTSPDNCNKWKPQVIKNAVINNFSAGN